MDTMNQLLFLLSNDISVDHAQCNKMNFSSLDKRLKQTKNNKSNASDKKRVVKT
eukprot:m.304718 g.304718  ORF g.304718 m.304718 type:complete len:54 (-) comp338975_c0_seq1:90-251(-)